MKQKLHFKRFFSLLLCFAVCEFSWAKFQVNGIYYELTSKGAEVTFNNPDGGTYSGDVVIPSSVVYYNGLSYDVVSIGAMSFNNCPNLTSVTIPESVTTIDQAAFSGCSKLTSVVIPQNVTSIAFAAFAECTSLTNISLPEGLVTIGTSAFLHCRGITSIIIPKSVTQIDGRAFEGCGLTSISVVSGNRKYDSRENCNAIVETESNTLIHGCENTIIPESVTTIGYQAFYNCIGLTSINIPEGVMKISDRAFAACVNLMSVTIPNSVKIIGNNAFYDCSGLKSLTCFAEGVPSTGEAVFNLVPQSTATLYVPAASVNAYKTAAQWKKFGQILPINGEPIVIDFADANVKQLCVANWDTNSDGELDKNEAATVTDLGTVFRQNSTITSFNELQYFTGLTSIADYAFSGCSSLTSVTIGNGVTTIGSSAFYKCSRLTSVTIPESVTSIGSYAFYDCSGLTSVTIGNGVTSIGDNAFNGCSGLTSVTIGNGVTSIGYNAFYGCSSLTSVTIGNGVTSIGGSAFYNCSKLTSVTIPKSVRSIETRAFFGCSGLASIIVASGNTRYDSRDNCNAIIEKSSNFLIVGCKNTVIPESVTSINAGAFSGCSGLTSIHIPNQVKRIEAYAFENCFNLTSIHIPNSVTSIYTGAIYGCSGLTSITVDVNNEIYDSRNDCNAIIETSSNTLIVGCKNTVIPESVTSIDGSAFYGCSGLTSITIPESVTSIGNSAFSGCSGLTSITIPESVTSIGSSAFEGCADLTSVTIPESVSIIGSNAFRNCSALESISVDANNKIYDSRNNCSAIIETSSNKLIAGCKNTIIPESVTSIDYHAFYNCSGLMSITIPESVTSIGGYAFSGCSDLKSVTCLSEKAPRIDNTVFYKVPQSSAKLYVPEESLKVYKSANYWKEFGTILPIGDMPETEPLNYYDMNGTKQYLADREGWGNILKNTPNALAVVESEQAEWASQQKNVLVTGADGNYSCADFLLIDLSQGFSTNASEAAKTGFFTPVSFKVTTGNYKRQAYAGYNTLCLPFSFKASDLSSSAKVFTFDTYDAEGSKVIFKAVSGTVAAGTPCIVKEKSDIVWTVNLSGKTIEASQPSEDNYMRGTYVTTDTWQGKGYSPRSSDGRFAPLTQYLHPFRACFSVSDLNNVGARGSLSAVFMDEDGVTAIDTLSAADNATDAPKSIYTLSGQRVKEIKRSGLYIVNGKKQYIEVK